MIVAERLAPPPVDSSCFSCSFSSLSFWTRLELDCLEPGMVWRVAVWQSMFDHLPHLRTGRRACSLLLCHDHHHRRHRHGDDSCVFDQWSRHDVPNSFATLRLCYC